MNVKIWEEKVVIPTYEIGEPEKNPIFLEKRVYQGSSGVVYPFPVIEKISDEKVDKEWQACYLENDFVKIMILPELGGRVQMAYDKIKQRHFVYYNEVIKPALVGLTGPWISGGIEFNWPQHHRPGTYDPVDFKIEHNEDGSKTIWCSEIERMSRTKGMAGFTLYPDKSYLEIKVRFFNRTSQPQSFLWWANPAVAVNDHYQSVFPPDVHSVFDHGKRDVSNFPIATGTYYKVDYSKGVDISKYKNIPVPTSFMAVKSDYNFVGGYEHDSKGGLLHVANHHVSPGKKQWTWGNGNFGQAWDRNLTDHNGPYIELMCGVYTDNQPDFSWIMPYEEKSFRQYFMPYRDLGMVKNASKDAMVNLEFNGEIASIKAFSTGIFPNSTVRLSVKDIIIFEEQFDFNPEVSFSKEVKIDSSIKLTAYLVEVINANGKLLISWSPEKAEFEPAPEAAKPAKEPKDIATNEELYLNGLHLDQYRHATYDSTDYYKEALARDPEDIRNNNALGMWFFRRGKFARAEKHFRKAFQKQIQRNPNPYDGEPLFNLGLALRFQGKDQEAYDAFYKSVWNAAFMDCGYFHIAQIDISRQDWISALDTIDRSLVRNWHNHKSRHLKVAILRKTEAKKEAITLAEESLKLDGFNFGILYEQYLLGDESALLQLKKLSRRNIHTYIEIAWDYAWAGLYQEALDLLDLGIAQQESVYPMAYYYKGYILSKSGDSKSAMIAIKKAERCSPNYCFPNRIESVLTLTLAKSLNPKGSKAPYYLGNFWYNARQYEDAQNCWVQSAKQDDSFPTVFRNLALSYYNKSNESALALSSMEKAFDLNKKDSRILMELDQLYKKFQKPMQFRLDFLEKYIVLVNQRDDLYLERASLYLHLKAYQKAYNIIMARQFHPWEGGEGKVTTAYVQSLTGLAKEAIEDENFSEAIALLQCAKSYPHNLGEGKLIVAQENELDYWSGVAHLGAGNEEQAKMALESAAAGLSEPTAAWFYNDQKPDTIFYQGLALIKLNKKEEAMKKFELLIDYGKKHLDDEVKMDYFAISLPDMLIWKEDLSQRNKIHCLYLMALGYKGQGADSEANKLTEQILKLYNSHSGALQNL